MGPMSETFTDNINCAGIPNPQLLRGFTDPKVWGSLPPCPRTSPSSRGAALLSLLVPHWLLFAFTFSEAFLSSQALFYKQI